METAYQIGPLQLLLVGDTPLATCVRDELGKNPAPTRKPDIVFDFASAPQIEDGHIISNELLVGTGGFIARQALLLYSVKAGTAPQLEVTIAPDFSRLKSSTILRRRIRALNWSHLTLVEETAKNFVYAVHDYFTQVLLLRNNATYVHASSLEKHGKALLLAGRGGVGKSAFMLKGVLERGYRYISDDLAVLDGNSRVFSTPKKIQVYGYNTIGEPSIRDAVLAGRSIADRAAWHARLAWKGPKRVRRRISAETLFGESRLADSAMVDRPIFLERHQSDDFKTVEISPSDFSYRCSMVLLDELNPFISNSISEHSATSTPILPSIADMQKASAGVMERSLQQLTPLLVRVPATCNPSELAGYLDRFMPGRNSLPR